MPINDTGAPVQSSWPDTRTVRGGGAIDRLHCSCGQWSWPGSDSSPDRSVEITEQNVHLLRAEVCGKCACEVSSHTSGLRRSGEKLPTSFWPSEQSLANHVRTTCATRLQLIHPLSGARSGGLLYFLWQGSCDPTCTPTMTPTDRVSGWTGIDIATCIATT